MTRHATSPLAGNRRASIVVLAVIAAIVAAACAAVLAAGAQGPGAKTVVHKADGTAEELPLDRDATYEITAQNDANIVEVKGGRVRVVDANCPNHDCVEQGWIDAPGRQIVCLPHKLWIEVVAEGAEASDSASSGSGGAGDGSAQGTAPAFDAMGS